MRLITCVCALHFCVGISAMAAQIPQLGGPEKFVQSLDEFSRQEPPAQSGNTRYDRERIGRWVENKECAYMPYGAARDAAVQSRIDRIIDEYENALTNEVQLQPGSASNGEVPTYTFRKTWSDVELARALSPLAHRFESPEIYGPAFDGVVGFFEYFSLPDGAVPDSRRHYSAGYFQNWVKTRASAARLIAVAYPADSARPAQRRVRLVSSLDAFELLLLNASITPPSLGDNTGFALLEKLADAWLDEPESLWPADPKYRLALRKKINDCQKKPSPDAREACLDERRLKGVVKFLKDTVNEVVDGLPTEGVTGVGYPVLPGCPQTADPRDSADLQARELFEPVSPTIGADSDDADSLKLRAGLYTIRQIIPILEENLPDSGKPEAGGLRVLRDLVFEAVHSNTPDAVTSDDPSLNNLNVLIDLAHLGVLRQTTRLDR